jgi:transcriptional regulator with XRE-family HTH domain
MEFNDHDREFLLQFGRLIAAKRSLLGMKEAHVCKTVGISQSQLSGIENGSYHGLKGSLINRLLSVLQIAWAELPAPKYKLITIPIA